MSEKVLSPLRTTNLPYRQSDYFTQRKTTNFNFSNRKISRNLIKAYADD